MILPIAFYFLSSVLLRLASMTSSGFPTVECFVPRPSSTSPSNAPITDPLEELPLDEELELLLDEDESTELEILEEELPPILSPPIATLRPIALPPEAPPDVPPIDTPPPWD